MRKKLETDLANAEAAFRRALTQKETADANLEIALANQRKAESNLYLAENKVNEARKTYDRSVWDDPPETLWAAKRQANIEAAWEKAQVDWEEVNADYRDANTEGELDKEKANHQKACSNYYKAKRDLEKARAYHQDFIWAEEDSIDDELTRARQQDTPNWKEARSDLKEARSRYLKASIAIIDAVYERSIAELNGTCCDKSNAAYKSAQDDYEVTMNEVVATLDKLAR